MFCILIDILPDLVVLFVTFQHTRAVKNQLNSRVRVSFRDYSDTQRAELLMIPEIH